MVTFHCMLQKKLGEQDVLVAPPIILLRSSCSPCSPGSRACAYLANILFVCVCKTYQFFTSKRCWHCYLLFSKDYTAEWQVTRTSSRPWSSTLAPLPIKSSDVTSYYSVYSPNLSLILHRFWDTTNYWLKIADFIYFIYFIYYTHSAPSLPMLPFEVHSEVNHNEFERK